MDKDNLNGIPEEETEEEIIMCSHCGKNEAVEGSEYCEACEIKLIKKPLPFTGIAAGVITALLSVVVFAFLVSGSVLSIGSSDGDEYVEQKNWYMAYECYYKNYMSSVENLNSINNFLNGAFETERAYVSPSLGVKKKMVEVVANYYGPLDAYYYATGFLSEEELIMPFMESYAKMYQDFQTTYTAVEGTFNKSFEENADYKAILTEMDTHIGKDGVNEVFLNYHKYVIAVNLDAPVSEQLVILRNLEKVAAATDDNYGWLCNPTLAQALYDSGELDEALIYLDKIIEANKSNYEAYRLKMKIQVMKGDAEAAGETVAEFRANHENCEFIYYADILEIEYLRITGDYDKAKALCVEADESYKNIPETNAIMDLTYMIENKVIMPTEIYRQRAMILMTEGDYVEAFNEMMEAYRLESYYAQYLQGSATLNDPNFYGPLYLSAVLANNSGKVSEELQPDVDYVLEMFGEGKISENIDAIINGEKTVGEVLTEGEFELV